MRERKLFDPGPHLPDQREQRGGAVEGVLENCGTADLGLVDQLDERLATCRLASPRGTSSRTRTASRRTSAMSVAPWWTASEAGRTSSSSRCQRRKPARTVFTWTSRSRGGLEGDARRTRIESEAERLVALGAAVADRVDTAEGFHLVLRDVEGNEFCMA